MRSRHTLVGAAVLGLATAAGCTAITGVGDLEESCAACDAGGDQAAPVDATSPSEAAPADTAETPDTPADAAALADVEDAAKDAPAMMDGPVVAYCASLSPQPAFCADFDEGSLVAGWSAGTDVYPADAASVSLDFSMSTSPPASFLASLAVQSNDANARLGEAFGAAHAHIVFSFDFRIDAWGPGDGVFLFSLYFDQRRLRLYPAGGNRFEEWLVPGDGGAQSVVHTYPLPVGTPALGSWYHFDLDVGGSPPVATVKVNGVTQFTNQPVSPDILTVAPTLNFGPYEYGGSGGWVVHFDNVVFDFPP